jgi:hypothetical protein
VFDKVSDVRTVAASLSGGAVYVLVRVWRLRCVGSSISPDTEVVKGKRSIEQKIERTEKKKIAC